MIETTGEGKSAVVTPDGKSRKKKKFLSSIVDMYSCGFCEMWCLVRVGDKWWVESGLGHVSFGIVGPVDSRCAAVPTSAIGDLPTSL